MNVRVRELLIGELDSLRFEPTDERIRGLLGERTVIDSTSAMLVWEPKRIVPVYAVPVEDIDGQLSREPAASASESPAAAAIDGARFAGRRVFDPGVPFSVQPARVNG